MGAGARPAGADNGPAVLGFCLSISSVGLLFISGGLSTLVSVGLSIPGMLQSRKGTRRVREGLTTTQCGPCHRGMGDGLVAWCCPCWPPSFGSP